MKTTRIGLFLIFSLAAASSGALAAARPANSANATADSEILIDGLVGKIKEQRAATKQGPQCSPTVGMNGATVKPTPVDYLGHCYDGCYADHDDVCLPACDNHKSSMDFNINQCYWDCYHVLAACKQNCDRSSR